MGESSALYRSDILNGWKEISSYLRMGIRTAQRYEEFGLPVRRPAGRHTGSVMATKIQLDAWITARPIRHSSSGSGPRSSPTWADFKAGIAEMKRLRTEMMRLRSEAVVSLEALHARLAFMQRGSGEKSLRLPNAHVVRPCFGGPGSHLAGRRSLGMRADGSILSAVCSCVESDPKDFSSVIQVFADLAVDRDRYVFL